jgi:hypothetical protein
MNGGGGEHPQSERWSFPFLFCGTQVTRVGMELHIFEGGWALLRSVQQMVRVPPYDFLHISEEWAPPLDYLQKFENFWRGWGRGGRGALSRKLPIPVLLVLTSR